MEFKKVKKKTPITLKQFIINNLRKSSWKWGPRNEAKKLAKVEYGKYKCAHCKKIHRNKDVKVDHINPVVDPFVGFVDWNTYIPRMFCEVSGYQLLCDPCHDIKTSKEKEIRKLTKGFAVAFKMQKLKKSRSNSKKRK
jgi:5-methylcytosine-specific restriction endonuclease McrA